MKILLIVVLSSVSMLAQNAPSRIAPACGPQGVSFDVKLDNSQRTVVQPEHGKAQVYFVQDKDVGSLGIGGTVESLIGIDGQWVGMNKNNSYFSVSVEPGDHHLCADVQSHIGHPIELLHFRAEAENVYYFRERVVPTPYGLYLFLDPIDSDEANYLINSYPLSISHPTK